MSTTDVRRAPTRSISALYATDAATVRRRRYGHLEPRTTRASPRSPPRASTTASGGTRTATTRSTPATLMDPAERESRHLQRLGATSRTPRAASPWPPRHLERSGLVHLEPRLPEPGPLQPDRDLEDLGRGRHRHQDDAVLLGARPRLGARAVRRRAAGAAAVAAAQPPPVAEVLHGRGVRLHARRRAVRHAGRPRRPHRGDRGRTGRLALAPGGSDGGSRRRRCDRSSRRRRLVGPRHRHRVLGPPRDGGARRRSSCSTRRSRSRPTRAAHRPSAWRRRTPINLAPAAHHRRHRGASARSRCSSRTPSSAARSSSCSWSRVLVAADAHDPAFVAEEQTAP